MKGLAALNVLVNSSSSGGGGAGVTAGRGLFLPSGVSSTAADVSCVPVASRTPMTKSRRLSVALPDFS